MSDTYLPNKDPVNKEWYWVIWCDMKTGTNVSGDEGELQGATISSVTWTVPTGLTQEAVSTAAITIKGIAYPINTVSAILLSGGTAYTVYEVECKMTDSNGEVKNKTIKIPVAPT